MKRREKKQKEALLKIGGEVADNSESKGEVEVD